MDQSGNTTLVLYGSNLTPIPNDGKNEALVVVAGRVRVSCNFSSRALSSFARSIESQSDECIYLTISVGLRLSQLDKNCYTTGRSYLDQAGVVRRCS